MIITRLGQAGLAVQTETALVLIDPYFTDSAFPDSGVHRKFGVPDAVWDLRPDLLLLTHDHIDHYDPETVRRLAGGRSDVTVLSPRSVWERLVREQEMKKNNLVLVSPGVVWTEKGVSVTALTARHSDPYAVGFALETDEANLVVTGDTLLDPDLKVPFRTVDFLFLPVNGRGNNMNASDAARLARILKAGHAIPVHYGVMDDLKPDVFAYENRFVMEDFVPYEIGKGKTS